MLTPAAFFLIRGTGYLERFEDAKTALARSVMAADGDRRPARRRYALRRNRLVVRATPPTLATRKETANAA